MPLRGESVGTAYIRVVADGSSIPRDIESEFDDVNKVADRQGSKFAKNYKKGVADELKKHDKDSLENAITEALAADKATERFFHGADWNRVKTRFNQEWGALGDSAIKDMEQHFLKKGSLDGIEEHLRSSVSRINADFTKMQAKSAQDAEVEAQRVRKLGEDFRAVWNNVETDSARAGNAVTRFFSKIRGGNRDVDKTTTVFGRLSRTIDHLGDGIGKAFGKGSRNNFLNFTGTFIGEATKLISLPIKIADNIGQFTKGFNEALSAGDSFFSAIKSGFSNMARDAEGGGTALAGAFSNLLITLPVLVVALLGVVAVLTTVAALVSGITAAIIALAGAISFAAIGAIAPLAGLIAPLVIGFGAMIPIFTALGSKTSKLHKEIKPVVAAFKDLGTSEANTFMDHLGLSFDGLAAAIRRAQPFADSIAGVFGDLGNQAAGWARTSDTANRFFTIMGNFAPEVIRKLGIAAGNTFDAFANIFVDLVPFVRRFLNYLDSITGDFQTFVSQNPDKIHQFFVDAAGSANHIWHFLGRALDVLLKLLGAGRKSGNTIFDDLTKQLGKFSDFLDKHPKGIKEFFSNGVQVARDIGTLAKNIALIVAALDTPEGRKNLQATFDVLNKIANLAPALRVISELSFAQVVGFLTAVTDTARAVKFVVDKIGDLAGFLARIGNIHIPNLDLAAKIHLPSLSDIKEKIGNFFSSFSGEGGTALLIRPPNLGWITGAAARIGHFFAGIGDKAGQAATTVAHSFDGVPGKLAGLAGGFAHAAATWASHILSELSTVPSSILGFFQGLGKEIISAIGSIHIPIHFDIPHLPSIPGIHNPFTASGGIFDRAQARIIGEAGAEAVVPLTGPLSAVDPSVRELSAIARGLRTVRGGGTQVQAPAGKTINVEQHITTPATDPVAAASEFLNHLTAVVA